MKKIVIALLILFMTVQSMTFMQAQEPEKTVRVLVINAYHLGYKWTTDQNTGINQTFAKAYPGAIIYTEFLDWKRFEDEQLIETSYQLYKKKYAQIPLDVIITTDDMGLMFALKYREEIFSNAPIVFSGIIESTAKEIIGDATNVTGVYEMMAPAGAIALIGALQPHTKTIYVVHDQTESGNRTADAFYKAVKEKGLAYKFGTEDLSEFSFSELLSKVTTLEKNSVIMMISYNTSIDGQIEKPEVFCKQLSEVASVPVYSIDEFLLGNGIMGGTFLSGIMQGEQAAELALRLLKGEKADAIAHVDQATVYTAVDEDLLIKFHISKTLVPKNVKIVNEYFSFFQTYKMLVISTISILTVLVIFIVILMMNIQSRRRSQNKVMTQKIELQGLNDQLSASEEELRAQNDVLQKYQEHLEYEVYHDSLTLLPNRFYLEIYVKDLLAHLKLPESKVVVMFLDIDNFKYINNTFGHYIGDGVLKTVAERLAKVSEGHFVSRLGGDEFIIVVKAPEDLDVFLTECLKQITLSFMQPICVDHENINLTASIGYSVYPDDGKSFDDLIIQSDMSMYRAKKDGKSTIRHYSKEMSDKLENDFLMVSYIRTAYENKEFVLHYQPQIDASTGCIVGFEALLRWNSKEFGMVPPNKIIPLAESSGMIIPIGKCIIKHALKFILDMKAYVSTPFKVSVNISVVQLREESFADELIAMLEEYCVEPSYLQIEITESVMINAFESMLKTLHYIRSKGITISLDDFGTGYSSLTYLNKLPISELKIDKSFVDDILTSAKQLAFVETIIALAHNLDLNVVAEGVETLEQQNLLLKSGCKWMQGYYMSKPLPYDEVVLYCQEKVGKC